MVSVAHPVRKGVRMSRRTFPRATAAGLIAAALGPPASAQAPNPWRGEVAALPTAPAPRAMPPKPTHQIVVGVGLNSVGGLTGTIVYRDAASAPVAPPPGITYGVTTTTTPSPMKPLATTTSVPAAWTPLPAPYYLQHYPQYFPPDPTLPRERTTSTDPEGIVSGVKPVVVPVRYTAPPRYMPPPAPLPVSAPVPLPRPVRPAPQSDVLIPVEIRFVVPDKGVVPVRTPPATDPARP
ncbi:CRISPR-associated protein Cas5 [bacterium]|nr:CRISPR-associated protein Cas5 [bacterium]